MEKNIHKCYQNMPVPYYIKDKTISSKKKLLHLTLAWITTVTAVLVGLAPRILVLFPVLFLLLSSILLSLSLSLSLSQEKKAAKPSPNQSNNQPSFSFKQYFTKVFHSQEDKILVLLIAGFLAYLLANTFLLSSSNSAYRKVSYLIVLLTSLVAGKSLIKILEGSHLWPIIRGIVLGTLLISLFILFEFWNKMSLTTFFIGELSPVVELVNNAKSALHLPNLYFNNNVSALNLIFWPALLMTLSWNGSYKNILKKILPLILAAAMVLLTFSSESETAKTALVLAAAAFFLTRRYPDILYKPSALVWAGSVLAVVPAIIYGNSLMLQYSKGLPFSAKDRIYIWHYTAVQVPETPIFGKGILAGSSMKKTAAQLKKYPQMTQQDHPALHPHNLFLQVWHELGAVGAVFLFLIGFITLKKVNRLPPETRPFGYATSITFFVTASFGYGMWQSWLMAAYCTSVIFFFLATRHWEVTTNPKQ